MRSASPQARHLPLVLNLSFGVGNELEGQARIDGIVDSVLAAHPDVVLTISAGNDGPGLSTIGFPGSAGRAISVGATLPGSFLPPGPVGAPSPDQLAYFSSRGGEVARPGSGDARRGLQHGAALERGRRGRAGHQHGRAARGGPRRAPGLGAGAGEASGRRARRSGRR